jgi:hypothetical protein
MVTIKQEADGSKDRSSFVPEQAVIDVAVTYVSLKVTGIQAKEAGTGM